jgi:hypothetical protein
VGAGAGSGTGAGAGTSIGTGGGAGTGSGTGNGGGKGTGAGSGAGSGSAGVGAVSALGGSRGARSAARGPGTGVLDCRLSGNCVVVLNGMLDSGVLEKTDALSA